MKRNVLRRLGRRVASMVAVTGLAAGVMVGAGGPASAGVVTTTIVYRCTWPSVGAQDMSATVSLDVPGSGAVGTRMLIGVQIAGLLNQNVSNFLRAVQAASLSGTATIDLGISHNSSAFTLGVPGQTIAQTPVNPTGMVPVNITASPFLGLIAYTPGDVVVKTGQQITLRMDTRKADGTPTALGAFNVPCTVKVTTPPQQGITVPIPLSGTAVTPPSLGTQVPGGTVNKTLTYNCAFPGSTAANYTGTVTGSIPASGAHGARLLPNVALTVPAPATFTNVLQANAAASLSGKSTMDILAANAGEVFTLGIPGPVPSASVPASGTMTVPLFPATPNVLVQSAGSFALALGSQVKDTMTPLKADGSPTSLGSFDVTCTLNTGQDPALGTITIT
ncbi:DUF6801 domain-containing protein [Actinocrispum wychmicini]|uniref:DUF6801 domain-containing protein n=1 Tax=Actinocrispum wychmicini TaxID=1213861 RepID=A0A4R2IR10_9PSEU|nr:DUF6801 domain-containing protein [Actinocrispum wychmicini]TCO46509.1 hypothetical protein EV192_11988 [Actinocrispum wychmicini]